MNDRKADPDHRNVSISGAASIESQSIEWYTEGQSRSVEVGGMQVSVRLVGRRGRRARIAITAPAGALFRDNSSQDARLKGSEPPREV